MKLTSLMAILSDYVSDEDLPRIERLIKVHVAAEVAEAQAEVDACNEEIERLEAQLAEITSEATLAQREALDKSDVIDDLKKELADKGV